MEGLSKSEAELLVYVHPSQSKNASRAILRELSSLLFKYSETFEGVLLAYAVDASNRHARILSGIHPYFGVRLKANLLIFSPKPDMLLEGKVVKLTQESIHVIVLGFSSAIIADEDVRDEFRYKAKRGEGLYVSISHKRHVIKVGTMIRFVVKSLDEEVLLMSGSLFPSHTGSISWFNKYAEDLTIESGNKKRREAEGESEMQEVATIGGEGSSLSNDRGMKLSKKLRIGEDH